VLLDVLLSSESLKTRSGLDTMNHSPHVDGSSTNFLCDSTTTNQRLYIHFSTPISALFEL